MQRINKVVNGQVLIKQSSLLILNGFGSSTMKSDHHVYLYMHLKLYNSNRLYYDLGAMIIYMSNEYTRRLVYVVQ